MDIRITYNKNDRAVDLFKIAYIKRKVIFGGNGNLLKGIGFLITFFLIMTGLSNEGIIHENTKHHYHDHYLAGFIVASIGFGFLIMILMFIGFQIWTKRSFIKEQTKFKIDERGEINLSFTDEMFTYRDKTRYFECAWSTYSSYLVAERFIFLCNSNGLKNSFAIGQQRLNKEQYDELITFLASKFPIWNKDL